MYRKNTAGQFFCFQGVDATSGGIKSGVTWTIRRCIDGTFAAATGTVTEDGTAGWYKMALSQADTNGNDISFNFTGTGAVPQTVNLLTTACDPTTATNFGITALPTTAVTTNGSLITSGSGTDQLLVASGKVVTPDTQKVDVNTLKTQAVTCAAPVTVLASVGTASTSTAQAGDVFAQLPSHFSALLISVGGHISNVDTLTTYTGDTPQTGDSFARIGATGSGLTSLAPSSTALSTAQWTNSLATNLGTLAGHDPGATLGTSTLTQTQVTGGAYSVQSASCVLGDARVAHLDADVSSRLAASSYTAPLSAAGTRTAVGLGSANLDTQLAEIATDVDGIAPIKAKTDQLTFTTPNVLDCNVLWVHNVQVKGTGTAIDPWGPV